MNRYRSYIEAKGSSYAGKPHKVLAWIDKRCKDCKRFISKYSGSECRCSKCGYKIKIQYNIEWNKRNKI